MVAWFIIAIGTLSLFAFIAINGVTSVDALGETTSRVEVVQRLDRLAAALANRASSPDPDGAIYLPAGIEGTSYGLPSDLVALGHTPYGQQIVYCPFGGSGATATTTQTVSYGGSSYQVGVRPINGRSYVVTGRPAYAGTVDPSLLGFLIAPLKRGVPAATCDQVTQSGNRFIAPNSIVRSLSRSTNADAGRRDIGNGPVYYVSGSGTGNGLSPSTPTSLNAALAHFQSDATSNVTLLLASGTYALAPAALDAASGGYTRQPQSMLTIASYSGTNDVAIQQVSGQQIRPGYNLTLRNVTLTGGPIYATKGTTIRLQGASVSNIDLGQASTLIAIDSLISTSSSSPAVFAHDSSRVSLSGNIAIHYLRRGGDGVSAASGSNILVQNASVSFSTPNGASGIRYPFYTDSTSSLSIGGSNLYYAGTVMAAIAAYGRTSLGGVNMTLSGGSAIFEVGGSAYLNLDGVNATGGTPTTVGVLDNGGGTFTGTATTLRSASACWSMATPTSILAMSPAGTGGAHSSVTNDEATTGILPADGTSPSGEQIQAYQAAVQRNEQRVTLRRANSSDWLCQLG